MARLCSHAENFAEKNDVEAARRLRPLLEETFLALTDTLQKELDSIPRP